MKRFDCCRHKEVARHSGAVKLMTVPRGAAPCSEGLVCMLVCMAEAIGQQGFLTIEFKQDRNVYITQQAP
jgi:hypothetical protein